MINYLANTTLAAENFLAQLVPKCNPSGTDSTGIPYCDFNQLLVMGQNIINFLIVLAFVITTLFIIIGAFRMIISQGNEEALSGAKANITAAIYGLIIVLVSWVVMNSVIMAFVDKDQCKGNWWKFEDLKCGEIYRER